MCWTILLLGLLAQGGCIDQVWNDTPQKNGLNAVSDWRVWRATGVGIAHPERAIDRDLTSYAVTGPSYQDAQLTIDLGKPCLFNLVTIDHGTEQTGCCRRVAVLTSMNGRDFVYRYAVDDTRRIAELFLPAPVLARYVRLQVILQGDKPWSIAEVYLQ
jgi:hypothetical protein